MQDLNLRLPRHRVHILALAAHYGFRFNPSSLSTVSARSFSPNALTPIGQHNFLEWSNSLHSPIVIERSHDLSLATYIDKRVFLHGLGLTLLSRP